MAFWNQLVILSLVPVFVVSQGNLPHTTCNRTYDKVGGFVEVIGQRALTHMLLNDRDSTSDVNDGHGIDWNEWSKSIHSLACRCAAKTREKGWKVFGIQFFGECWSGPMAHNTYNMHGAGQPTYQFIGIPPKPCNKSLDHECAGGEFVNYIYRLQDLNVNGGYTNWSEWSSCSKSCGTGKRSRDRTCTNPMPAGNGRDCQHLGPETEEVHCNPHPCPTLSVNVDGGWSVWTPWTKCSVSCGGGTQARSRTCTNPKPEGIGKSCQGHDHETRACLEKPCSPPCNKAMDVGIILDGSGSVKQENFKKALDFLGDLVSYYRISPHDTHFGMITYSTNPTMEFKMADQKYHRHTSLKQRLQSVKYPDGMTHTDRALLLAGLALFTPFGGDRPGRSNVLVVFTDGKTSDDSKPYPEVLMPLQAKGVRIIAVGIGPEVDHEELLEIAMGDPNYVVHATTYDTLKDKLNSIRDDSCRDKPPPPPTPECHRFDPLGMSNGGISAPSITASSQLSKHDGPELARLNIKKVGKLAGAWTAKYNNSEQWLQVYFEQAVKVIRAVTQGREETNHFVKSYWLSYSQDGEYFTPYTHNDKIVIFKGNSDGSSEVTNSFPKPLYTRYVRVHPESWSGRISMRVEFYGCRSGFRVPPVNHCYKRLGMEKGDILDGHIKASSYYSKETGPQNSRLYLHSPAGKIGAWRPKTNDLNQWLQVDLGPITKVNIIATQGRQGADQWVESYSVSSSYDAVFWDFYRQRGRTTIFSGNVNNYAVVNQALKSPIYARHIRIHPKTWHSAIAMRMEFYGCRIGFDVPAGPQCIDPLGMLTGAIPNAHITSTSSRSQQTEPFFARLRLPAGAWSPKTNDIGQWLQINIGKIAKVTRIATQGSFSADEWVTSYGIEYSRDGGHYDSYSRDLEGNHDRTSIVGHILYPEIYAKYIRIRPKAWHGTIALRLEIYGCRSGFTPPTPASCMKPLGIENGQTSDSQLSASSKLSASTGPSQGRLHLHSSSGMAGAWVAKTTKDQWFGVDFYDTVKVTRMSIQGREDADQWVSSFILKSSIDGYMYETYKVNGKDKLFHANKDRYTVVSHVLSPPIAARYFRIYPKTWHNAIALRVDYYGCTSDFVRPTKSQCTEPVGLENQEIPDPALNASSSWNIADTGPQWGRLNSVAQGPQGGAWVARTNDDKQWLQVDLGGPSKVTRCATQGRDYADDWVTKYKVQYSSDGRMFVTYQKYGVDKEFQGNGDRSTVVVNVFDPIIENARYIRIVPQEWHNHIALRMELFACKGAGPILPPTNGPSCSNAIDLGIAVDSSGGVSLGDFQKVQTFLRRLVDELHVSLDGNRMGIICYNYNTIPIVNFADKSSQDPSRMKMMISYIPYMFGSTRTDKALDFANHYFFSNVGGDRPDKTNILLVLTNGKKDPSAASYSAALAPLLKKKVKVIAVGVGAQADNSELLAINGQHQDRVVHMNSFDKLYKLLGNVPQGSCAPPTAAPPSPRCPLGWISYKSHCYFFDHSSHGNNWYYSRRICSTRTKGGYLVDIRDHDEWRFVKNHLQRGKQYYIGMRDEPLESWWMWQDGTLARFFKWAYGEPNGSSLENCAVILSNGLYNDISCQSNHSNYICKAKMQSP